MPLSHLVFLKVYWCGKAYLLLFYIARVRDKSMIQSTDPSDPVSPENRPSVPASPEFIGNWPNLQFSHRY